MASRRATDPGFVTPRPPAPVPVLGPASSMAAPPSRSAHGVGGRSRRAVCLPYPGERLGLTGAMAAPPRNQRTGGRQTASTAYYDPRRGCSTGARGT
jgi:hypothetical protein